MCPITHLVFPCALVSPVLSREQFVTFSLQEKHTFYTRERVIAIRIHTLFWKPFPWACQNSWNPFIQLVLINVVIGMPWCGLTFISFTIEYFPHTLAKKSFILQIGNTENNTYFLPCVQAKFLACWLSAIFWVFNGKRPTQMLNMTIVYTLFLTIYFAYLFSINTWISAAIKFTWLCNNVVGGTGFLAIHLVL